MTRCSTNRRAARALAAALGAALLTGCGSAPDAATAPATVTASPATTGVQNSAPTAVLFHGYSEFAPALVDSVATLTYRATDPDGDAALACEIAFGDTDPAVFVPLPTCGAGDFLRVEHRYRTSTLGDAPFRAVLRVTDPVGAVATAESLVPVDTRGYVSFSQSSVRIPETGFVRFTYSATDPHGGTLVCALDTGFGARTLPSCIGTLDQRYQYVPRDRETAILFFHVYRDGAEVATRAGALPNATGPRVVNLRLDPATGPYSVGRKACAGRYTLCVRFAGGYPGAPNYPFGYPPMEVDVDWGDGTQWRPNAVPANTPLVAPHDYAAPGTYTIRVRARTAGGLPFGGDPDAFAELRVQVDP